MNEGARDTSWSVIEQIKEGFGLLLGCQSGAESRHVLLVVPDLEIIP